MLLCGIDYGSKMAGTTALCFREMGTGQTFFRKSGKNEDADQFLLEELQLHKPQVIFLDAPLSLPGIYRSLPGCHDYFYRQADRQLKAMSPMFLGGLTARAMQLQERLLQAGLPPACETYPAAQARLLDLPEEGYKKEPASIRPVVNKIKQHYPLLHIDQESVASWHHVDALLALVGAIRFTEGRHEGYGDAVEGMILV
jgi:predicted nuclease with RNAse H fold